MLVERLGEKTQTKQPIATRETAYGKFTGDNKNTLSRAARRRVWTGDVIREFLYDAYGAPDSK